ncbi:MAG: hypothetical protein AABZ69_03720, partial [Candidatus Binatota bacterium]
LERFWAKVFDWLSPFKETLPPHEVRINPMDGQAVLDLYLFAEGHDGGLFRYSFGAKGANREGVLSRLAPGHYQTVLPISAPGDYRIGLVEELHGQRLSYPMMGYTLSFDPRAEVIRNDFNLALLEKLARSTGGEINPGREEALRTQEETTRTFKPLRPQLLFLALALFLLEIFFRRFFLPTGV